MVISWRGKIGFFPSAVTYREVMPSYQPQRGTKDKKPENEFELLVLFAAYVAVALNEHHSH